MLFATEHDIHIEVYMLFFMQRMQRCHRNRWSNTRTDPTWTYFINRDKQAMYEVYATDMYG